MGFLKKVAAGAAGLVATATSSFAALDLSTVDISAGDLEAMAPKILLFVIAGVVVGAIIRLVRKAG